VAANALDIRLQAYSISNAGKWMLRFTQFRGAQ
jgi:hypothetical protein